MHTYTHKSTFDITRIFSLFFCQSTLSSSKGLGLLKNSIPSVKTKAFIYLFIYLFILDAYVMKF